MHKRVLQAVAVIMTMAMLISGCASEASNIGLAKGKEEDAVDTGFTVTTVGSYDSADTAVVMSIDSDNSCVSFMNMATGKQYTLYYDGATYIKDKYDSSMSISQLRAGDVVDVNFLKGKRKIASIQLSPKAWVYDHVENYDLGGVNKTASIGSSTFSLPDNAVILSDGRRTEVMDVVSQDVITVSGIDHEIYSITVEKGHGYLRLKNDQALLGGWIEVGSRVIREITEDMLLVVPEGSYQVLLSNDGVSCKKEVVIERDKEVVLDVGDIEIAEDKTGKILFNVTPDNAEVTVDGELIDADRAVELPYGIHQVHLEAEGYDSLTKYIQVGSEKASISFTLEKVEEEDDTSSISENSLEINKDDTANTTVNEQPIVNNQSSISENTISSTKNNKVYIDTPKSVEVYLDSNYMGLSPVSFNKTVGSHTITLRKSGYKTKSYTIYLYNDGEDITYSFTDLEEESSTVSGSTGTTSSAGTNTTSSMNSGTTTSTISSMNSGTTTSTVSSMNSGTTSDTSTSDPSGTTSDTSTTTSSASSTTSSESSEQDPSESVSGNTI